jgi:hypothetical protein
MGRLPMHNRVHTLLCLLWWCCIGWVVAESQSSTTLLRIPLYHQVIDSRTTGDIVPKGIITFDYVQNTTTYKNQDGFDLTNGEGIYRVGILDQKLNTLRPSAFTKLVLA